MDAIHPKVLIPNLVLLLCAAGLTAIAAFSDDVGWKVPVTAFVAAVLQGIIGYLKRAGVEGLKVDVESADREEVRAAVVGKV